MTSLRITKILLVYSGLDYYREQHSKCYLAYRFLCIAIFIIMIQPFFSFLAQNYDDMVNFTMSFAWLFSSLSCIAKSCFLHKNGQHMASFLRTIQTDIAGQHGSSIYFKSAEKRAHIFGSVYGCLLIACGIVYGLMPIFWKVYLIATGYTGAPDRTLPFQCIYLFNIEPLANYIFGYFLQIVYVSIGITVYLATTGLFMGGCEYIIAYLKDFAQCIVASDAEYHLYGNDRQLHAGILRALHQHYHILQLMQRFAHLQSGVIFVQFVSSTFLITMFVFQLKSASHGSEYVLCVLLTIGLVIELFVHSYFSTCVTCEAIDAGRALCNGRWYNYPVRSQRIIVIMLIRLQHEEPMRGLGIIDCSLQNFKAVFNMVGSMMAVLGRME